MIRLANAGALFWAGSRDHVFASEVRGTNEPPPLPARKHAAFPAHACRSFPIAGSGRPLRTASYGAVIVSGSNLTLGDGDVAAARDLLERTTLLVLQSEIPDAANVAAARAVKQAGGRVLINAAPARPLSADLQPLIDIIVVNAIEAEMLGGVPVVETLDGALEAARKLVRTFPEVVATAGGAGVAYANRDGEETIIAAVKVKVESTHGAGDEFIGVLAAEIASGKTINDALKKANMDAAKLVGTPEADRLG